MIDVWKKIYYGWDSDKGYGPHAYITVSSMQLGYLLLNDSANGDVGYHFQVQKHEIPKLIEALKELEKCL